MTNYSNLAATAKRLLASYGQKTPVTRNDGAAIDPVSGESSGKKASSFDAYTVATDSKTNSGTSKTLLMSADEKIKQGYVLFLDGESWSIDSFSTIAPGKTAIIYEVTVVK